MTSASLAGGAPVLGDSPPLRVLVTGGAQGIGLAIALSYAKRGDRVFVCDTNEQELSRLLIHDDRLHGVIADVSDDSAVERLMKAVTQTFGGLDVLVNNAAITGPFGPVDENDPAHWAQTISVNLVGQFHCIHHAVPLLKQAGGGSIVNISSVAGRLGYPQRSAYSASKWGIIGLTESLAMELGPEHIRVNAVLPGIVDNERHRKQQRAQAQKLEIDEQAMFDRYVSTISMREKVSEVEIADLILFITSHHGRHITGQSLGVCGNVETMRRS